MFAEGKSICDKTEEQEKYLMTFQNILSRVPKWNNEIVLKETKRIQEESGCSYLEDLITCVHIAHLKMLSSVRTGKTQKKIEINIPKLPVFIHSVYINISRELYTNVYLFDPTMSSLLIQKNKEKVKEIIRQTILNTIRDNIPIEQLLRAYLDETTELMDEPKKSKKEDKSLRFSETNMAMSIDNEESVYEPPEEQKLTIMGDCPISVDDLTPVAVDLTPVAPNVDLTPVDFLQIESIPKEPEPPKESVNEPKEPKELEIVLDIEELK